jgi:hypothetical protein
LPATGREQQPRASATSPRPRSSVQGALRKAKPRAGLRTRDVGPPTLRHADAPPRLAAGVHLRARQRDLGHAPRDTPMLSRHLTPPGPEDAVQRMKALLRGRSSCSPCAPSAPPTPQRLSPASPIDRPRTTRPWTPSAAAAPAPTASASRPAPVVDHLIPSPLPGAIDPGHHVSLRQPRRGGTTHATTSGLGRPAGAPAPCPKRCDPCAAPRPGWPPRAGSRPLHRLSHAWPTTRAASARRGPAFLASGLPGADHCQSIPPSPPASLAADSHPTVRPGGLHEPTALAPCEPSHRSPARSAHQRCAPPGRWHRALHPSGTPHGTATARPRPMAPPPAPPLRPLASQAPSPTGASAACRTAS